MSARDFIRDIKRHTYPNPFDRRERVRRDHTAAIRAMATVSHTGHTSCIHLLGIRSLARGNGHGSAALDWLCTLADRHQVTIAGVIEPFGTIRPRLSIRRLMAWYRRRGFVVTIDRHFYRHPSPALCGDIKRK